MSGCANARVVDQLPHYIRLDGAVRVAGNTSDPTIDADPEPPVTVTFNDDLGGGVTGLAPGDTITITIPVRVDDDLPAEAGGTDLVNTVTIAADNAPDAMGSATVTSDVASAPDAAAEPANTSETTPPPATSESGTTTTAIQDATSTTATSTTATDTTAAEATTAAESTVAVAAEGAAAADAAAAADPPMVVLLTPDDTNTISIDKTNTADGEPAGDNTTAQPGDSYTYNFVVTCSSIEFDCVDLTFTDTFPSDVSVDESTIPASVPGFRDVTWDGSTLTVVYTEDLANPADETGKIAGTSDSFIVSVTVPADTPLEDEDVIANEATVTSFSIDPDTLVRTPIEATDPSDVIVDVPVVLDSGTTKSFSDPSAIAGDPNAVTTIQLGGINQSSNSAEVTEMTIEESTPATFEYLDLTGVSVTQYPAGAEQAQLYVCPQASAPCDEGEWVAGGTGTPPGPSDLAIPGSVPADQVAGVRVVFTATPPGFIENQANGGTAAVEADMALRDTVRSTGEVIAEIPETTIINNTATTVVDDEDPATDPAGSSSGAQYQILPPTIEIQPSKTFFADGNGNFTPDGGEYAVIGENSGVSMLITATNQSAFPISEITITEPATSTAASEFEKFDPTTLQLTYPAGAANAHVVVTYDGGATTQADYPAPGPGTIPLTPPDAPQAPAGKVTSITVTFTGDPAVDDGNTIQAGAAAGIGVHGNLNDLVDEDDVNGPAEAAGIDNCADVAGAGTPYPGGTGTAVGTACAELPIEERNPSTGGTKIPSQDELPADQPVLFTLTTTNNGNLPLIDLVVSDPADDGSGIPPTPDTSSVWYWGMFVAADVVQAAMAERVTIQAYTPAGGWQDLDSVDPSAYPDVIGVRGQIDVLNPTETFDLQIQLIARVPAPPGQIPPAGVVNCYGITADTTAGGGAEYEAQTHCSPPIVPVPISESASVNKAIAPQTLSKPIPGMTPQTARVTLQIHNTGSISAKTLQIIDNDVTANPADVDGDFWDAVDFAGISSIQAPAVGELRDANQIQIDAWIDPDGAGPAAGSWVAGTPAAPGSSSVPVLNDQVRGLRFTFTDTSTINDGYVMTTCPSADVTCAGVVEFDVTPRQTLVSTGEPLPDTDECPDPEPALTGCSELLNTASGAFNTRLHPDDPALIPEVIDNLFFVPGDPALDVTKTPENATVQPGQLATFTLTTTNSGTANLPDVTVSDPLPQGILFDDTFADPDTGQPYTVTWSNLPADYPAAPDPVFEQTPDPADPTRVGLLRWTFPGWDMPPNAAVAIFYRYTLEPGVVAGQQITNTMGASAPVDDLVCSDTNDGEVTDGDFGDGLYCTDPADVTVTAGANFASRKWVAGTPELGWYNLATGELGPVGATPGCLSLDANGRTYTTNPCIAITNPGEDFFYVLRLQNAGTEPALTMTVVDTFPAPGDQGVFGAARGTQWATAPTLTGTATYDGPATGEIQYTIGSPCAAGVADWPCDDADWTSAAGPNTTALRLLADFDPDPLPPGGTVDISFSMTTPVDVPRVADPTVAYNSIAHSETTQIDNGGERELAPLEPLKVGVATLYGNLQVTKEIGENPGNLPLDDLEFTFTYDCTLTNGSAWLGNGTVTATPTAPGLVTGIPSGSTCVVTETGTNGGIASEPVSVVIEPSLDPATPVVTTAAFINDFPLGELQLFKEVTGFDDLDFVGGPYPITVTCSFAGTTVPGFPVDVEVSVATPTVIDTVPVGSVCTVEETDPIGATSVTYDPANADGIGEVTIPANGPATVSVTITNDFPIGSVTLLKTVTGGVDPVFTPGPYPASLTCAFNGATLPGFPVLVELEPGTPSEPVVAPVGSICTVTETDDHGATTVTYDPANAAGTAGQVTVPEGSDTTPISVTISNDFPVGGLQVNKAIGENEANLDLDDLPYTFRYQCTFDPDPAVEDDEITFPDPAGLLVATVNDPAEVDGLPAGAVCEVWETIPGNQGGIPDATVADPAVVTIAAGTIAQPYTPVTVTNDYPTGRAELVKLVAGDAQEGFTTGPYLVMVNCWAADQIPGIGDPFPGFPVAVELFPNEPVGRELPVGTTCWFQEPESEVPAGGTVTYEPANPAGTAGVVSIEGEPDENESFGTVSVTNTFTTGSLVVEKGVSGPGSPAFSQGPFVFGVSCDYLGVEDVYSVAVVVPGSTDGSPVQSEPITGLPVGAVCTVTEIDTGGADGTPPPVTVTIPDADDEGVVEVVIAGFVNQFSAAQIQVAKVLDGDDASAHTGDVFTLAVTCQYDLNGTLVTVYSGSVPVSGGQTLLVTHPDGDPVLLPPGAHCFAAETDSGGADSSTVDFDSYDNAVIAEQGDELGTLTITAVNTFTVPPVPPTPAPPNPFYPPDGGGSSGTLSWTGFPAGQWLLIGFALFALGACLVSVTRRRRRTG